MSDTDAANHDMLEAMLGDFLDESEQLLGRLNDNLMGLDEWVRTLRKADEPCDAGLLNEMFRSAHSLKGLSAMLGLDDINQLTHRLENVFDAARAGQLPVDAGAVELMFRSVDRLSAMVELLRNPGGEPVDWQSERESIRGLLQTTGTERAAASQADAEAALNAADLSSSVRSASPPEAAPAPSAELPAGAQDEPDPSGKYLSLFADEAELALDQLTESLLALEKGAGAGELRRAMCIAHRIKGSAASVGLNRAAKLAHGMESSLQGALDAGRSLPPLDIETMLQGTDGLRQCVAALRAGRPEVEIPADLARKLLAAQAESAAAHDRPAPETLRLGKDPEGFSVELRRRIAEACPQGLLACLGEVEFQPRLPAAALKARLIYDKLGNLAEVLHFEPAPERLDDLEEIDRVRFGIATEKPLERIRDLLRIVGVLRVTLEPLEAAEPQLPASVPPHEGSGASAPPAAPALPAAAPRPAGPERDRPSETVRVDTERLDQLMNLAGQLVINKARFAQIGGDLKNCFGATHAVRKFDAVLGLLDRLAAAPETESDPQRLRSEIETLRSQAGRARNDLAALRAEIESLARAHGSIGDLAEAVHQLDRVSAEIQQSVMATRMVPIGPLFSRFKRVVRDIGRAGGKEIRLVIRGEKTELDKRLIDELSDPLTHAIRNAADHGIEPPQVRAAAGKPTEGTVTLDAFHRGNGILIQVRDDGRGLDTERILQKCLTRGLLTEADAARMTPRQIWQMVWEPGFSTAERVTEVSGRGMGMDIVRSKIAGISGTVDLDSVPGQGTTLTIKLPITLAILPSLMVELGGDCFALPMESVQEIFRAAAGDVTTIRGREAVRLRNRVIALERLDGLVAFRGRRRPETADGGLTTLVVVGEPGRETALAVDRVIGEEDVVIKSIAENFRNVPGIAGATILGDGRVALIFDVPALIEMLSRDPQLHEES